MLLARILFGFALAAPVTVLPQDYPVKPELGFPQLESLAWNGLLALGGLGFDIVASSPEEFARWIRAESERWARVIRASGASAD